MIEHRAFELNSPEETVRLGKTMGGHAYPGLLLLLYGDLGVGKTQLCKGIGEALGVPIVRSPTFTLINCYEGKLPLVHSDLYRLEPKGAPVFELEEALDEGAFVVVEWADRWLNPPDQDVWTLRLAHKESNDRGRSAQLEALGGRAQQALEKVWESFSDKGEDFS